MNAKIRKTFIFSAGTSLGLLCVTHAALAQNRFSATDVNNPAREFEQRFHETPRNIAYIVARALGIANKVVEEQTGSDDDTEIITTQNNGNAISGSVVVSPGVSANEIVIININEGNTTAIRR